MTKDLLKNKAVVAEVRKRILSFEAGAIVLLEGTRNREMYKILRGNVEIYVGYGTDKETLVGILGVQDCFGEFGVLLHEPSIYTVVAFSDLDILRINEGDMGDFIKENHHTIMDIMRNMAKTLNIMKTQIELLVDEMIAQKALKPGTIEDLNKAMHMYDEDGAEGKEGEEGAEGEERPEAEEGAEDPEGEAHDSEEKDSSLRSE